MLKAYFRSLLGNREDADDLTPEKTWCLSYADWWKNEYGSIQFSGF
jgi:hypothetical protein